MLNNWSKRTSTGIQQHKDIRQHYDFGLAHWPHAIQSLVVGFTAQLLTIDFTWGIEIHQS